MWRSTSNQNTGDFNMLRFIALSLSITFATIVSAQGLPQLDFIPQTHSYGNGGGVYGTGNATRNNSSVNPNRRTQPTTYRSQPIARSTYQPTPRNNNTNQVNWQQAIGPAIQNFTNQMNAIRAQNGGRLFQPAPNRQRYGTYFDRNGSNRVRGDLVRNGYRDVRVVPRTIPYRNQNGQSAPRRVFDVFYR